MAGTKAIEQESFTEAAEAKAFYTKALEQVELERKNKILDAEKEAAINKERVEKSLHHAKLDEQMTDFAYQQKAYYDALKNVGFSEEMAKEIFLKSVNGVPYVYYGMDFGVGNSFTGG